jgi:hypothetical protein
VRPEFRSFLDLVARLGDEGVNRSENDVSSRLGRALESLGLHTVLDTAGGADRRRRPDILCYADAGAADLVTAADVVIEAKRPVEVTAFPDLKAAITSDGLWQEKFVPYVRAHAEQVAVFVLTSFVRFLAVPVTAAVRTAAAAPGALHDQVLKDTVAATAVEFELTVPTGAAAWERWCEDHLAPSTLRAPPLSETLNLRRLSSAADLEQFAEALADVVVGRQGRGDPIGAALVSSIDLQARQTHELPGDVQRALLLYTMAQHPGMALEQAEPYLSENLAAELGDFVAASVHSLVGRLFAYKTIEDCFCLDVTPPLIEAERWMFHTRRYDACEPEALPTEIFRAMAGLAGSANPVVRDLATTGAFYDWIAPRVDPAAFRRLVAAFFVHDLRHLDGDLLGRFFEMYAQRLDRRRRRELGQYYTPQPIVSFMWRRVLDLATERGFLPELVALDPGMGSGTFLVEGARRLDQAGVPRFWERLVGFDIDPQVVGVANVNLYLTALGLLDRSRADSVGELHLYPTDTLDPANGGRLRAILPLLAGVELREFLRRRIALSEGVKRGSRFEVVIGNPPYRNNSDRTLAQVAERFPRLLETSRSRAAARSRNPRDDYAWFFAAADYYIRDRGMIAFVVSASFCTAQSYRYFREDLLRYYQVRSLVHLGGDIFRDVGPRTTFVIIFLERRDTVVTADAGDQFEYIDLRPLARGCDQGVLGTPNDPRLEQLAAAASEDRHRGALPAGVTHTPRRERNFALFPAGEVVAPVERAGPPVHRRQGERSSLFVKKWPGLITAFDVLFKSETQDALEARMREFLDTSRMSDRQSRERLLDDLAARLGVAPEERERFAAFADTARSLGLAFEPQRVRRAVSGSAPNQACWYPDSTQSCWLYYEPRLAAARNRNVGRDPGWGTMSQWREPASHTILPKLVYTTARDPARGFKAFVLHDEWLVKLHGGTRQQFHYTGIENPLIPQRLDGLPNNLGDKALALHRTLTARGRSQDDILFYVAGLYNSRLAEDYLAQGGDDRLCVPADPELLRMEVVEQVADAARRLRNLRWLAVRLTDSREIEMRTVEDLLDADTIDTIGLRRVTSGGGRFRPRQIYQASENTMELLDAKNSKLETSLDEAVSDLFGI